MIPYSIGIVTYIKRFDQYFIPLIKVIKGQRPDIEITVCINGEYNNKFDNVYRKDILNFIADQPNCFPMVFTEFRSLSKLWNQCLINSTNEHVLLLNDDLTIADGFFDSLERYLDGDEYKTNPQKSFKINSSWSHAFLNRKEIDQCNWFDETLLGVGEEDGEMQWTYEKTFGENSFKSAHIDNITNHVEQNNCIAGQRKNFNKYSLYNHERFLERYKIVPPSEGFPMPWDKNLGLKVVDPKPNQHPSEKHFWENRHKL